MKKSSFIMGIILLTFINFTVRSMGFIYRIILSRMIGPQAIGLYQMVFPFLMVIITIPTAGIPIAVSKLVAKENSYNNRKGIYNIMFTSMVMGAILSLVITILVSFNLDFLANRILKSNELYYPLLWTVPAIGIITFSSILRGFFYGMKNLRPAAAAQILEQITRIAFVIGLLYIKSPQHPITMATIAIIGISVGELFGLVYLIISFSLKKLNFIGITTFAASYSIKSPTKEILYISIPITISRLLSVFMQSINSILIPHRLMVAGYSQIAAIEVFGKISGMAMPLLFLPFTVTSALVINIIPNISEQLAMNNLYDVSTKINQGIRLTLLVAIPVTMVYTLLGNELAAIVFHQQEVGLYLSIIGASTLFLCMQHTLSGILHGMGKQVITTINFMLGMLIQLYCTYYLVPNPRYGIYGFFIGFILSSFVIFFLNLITLNKYLTLHIPIYQSIIKPFFCSMATVGGMYFLLHYPIVNISNKIYSPLVFFIGGLIYLVSLILTKTVDYKSILASMK